MSTGGPQRPFVPASAVGGFDWEWDVQAEAYRPCGALTDIMVIRTPAGGWEVVREAEDGEHSVFAHQGAGFYGPDGAMHEAAPLLREEQRS